MMADTASRRTSHGSTDTASRRGFRQMAPSPSRDRSTGRARSPNRSVVEQQRAKAVKDQLRKAIDGRKLDEIDDALAACCEIDGFAVGRGWGSPILPPLPAPRTLRAPPIPNPRHPCRPTTLNPYHHPNKHDATQSPPPSLRVGHECEPNTDPVGRPGQAGSI